MMNQALLDETPAELPATRDTAPPRRSTALLVLSGLWLILFFAALWNPPLLDDADATHASAARHMALTGDLVTLHVDGIRYLEKAPLPYWLVALSFRLFGFNTFAAHLPQAIAVLLLTLLGYRWAERAFSASPPDARVKVEPRSPSRASRPLFAAGATVDETRVAHLLSLPLPGKPRVVVAVRVVGR